jgi:hypothetical protein
MKLIDVLRIADNAYGERNIGPTWEEEGAIDEDGYTKKAFKIGDGLATFIIVELAEVCEQEGDAVTQLQSALEAMENAERDIAMVREMLSDKLLEAVNGKIE